MLLVLIFYDIDGQPAEQSPLPCHWLEVGQHSPLCKGFLSLSLSLQCAEVLDSLAPPKHTPTKAMLLAKLRLPCSIFPPVFTTCMIT